MKILIISGTFPPRKFGGITGSSFKLAVALKNLGHKVTVFTTDTGNDKNNRLNVESISSLYGFEVYYFKNISNKIAFKYRFYTPIGINSKLRSNIKNFDIIAIQDYRSIFNIIIYYFSKKYKIPYVIRARGSLPYNVGNKILKIIFDKLYGNKILQSASKLIALSRIEAENFQSFGGDRKKIEIVPNWVNIKDYINLPEKGSFRKKNQISSNKKIILSLGRLNKIKGLDLLILACSEVFNKIENVELIIVGPDDGDFFRLKNLVKSLKIEQKVKFLGPLYGEEKIAAYVDANVFVLPSIYEVFGNTIIEALACGTPVITTIRCQISDLVEKAGLVTEYNSSSMKEAIIKILTDHIFSEKMGNIGRKIVLNEFNHKTIIKRLEKIYLNSIEKTE